MAEALRNMMIPNTPDIHVPDGQEYWEEYRDYIEKIPLTAYERRKLREWVKSGHSVHEPCESRYLCLAGYEPCPDFIDVMRMDAQIRNDLKGKSRLERKIYLMNYCGFDDYNYKNDADIELLRWQISKLRKELYHLWDFVGQEGLWCEAKEHLEEVKDESIDTTMESILSGIE